VRRTVSVAALALLLGGCAASEPEPRPLPPPRAAEPQHAELGWRELVADEKDGELVFEVDELDVTETGWSARIAVSNRTSTAFDVETGPGDYSFGLMLFATGDLKAAEKANREGRLPAIRRATRIVPAPPSVLRPGTTWRATLSAPGSLAAGSWVRVVFGAFLGRDDPPEELRRVVWFTDRSHRLL
jgi:hypothetical protein